MRSTVSAQARSLGKFYSVNDMTAMSFGVIIWRLQRKDDEQKLILFESPGKYTK